jgi:predicted Zn-dependent protease
MGRFVPVALLTLAVVLAGAQAPTTQAEGDLVRRAATAYESGDIGLSVQLYRQFLAEHPQAAEIRSNLAAALIADGRVDEAIDEYRAALKSLPGNRLVMNNLALAYYKLGRYADAMETLSNLEKIQPLETHQSLLLADCLLQLGEPGRAAALLKPLEEYSDDRALTYMLGMALLRDNRTTRRRPC